MRFEDAAMLFEDAAMRFAQCAMRYGGTEGGGRGVPRPGAKRNAHRALCIVHCERSN